MARTKIHVGLEIGTSKTCVVVGEVKSDGSVKILGVGVEKSAGIRKGEISDYSQARISIKEALIRAEEASDVEIASVFLAVTGSHITGVNNIGTYRLPEGRSIVEPDDVEQAKELAREIPLPPENFFLHNNIIRQFRLDGLEHSASPAGLSGKKVEADFHIIHGVGSRIQSMMKCVRETPVEIDDVVFSPIATAQVALNREARERGALVIDIGGGTTDYALYLNGMIEATGCIPVGGDHVTNDIALATELPFSEAEQLKIKEGDASGDPAQSVGTIKVTDDLGMIRAEVKRSLLNEVIRARLEETLRLVKRRLPDQSIEAIGTGVFLCGGSSQMRGFDKLARDVFGRDIYRPDSTDLSGVQSSFRDPQFTTALGLIRYAQLLDNERTATPGFFGRIARMLWPFGN